MFSELQEFVKNLKLLPDTDIDIMSNKKPTLNTNGCIGGLVYLVIDKIPELKEIYNDIVKTNKYLKDSYDYYFYIRAFSKYLGFDRVELFERCIRQKPFLWGIESTGRIFSDRNCWGEKYSNEFNIKVVIERFEILMRNSYIFEQQHEEERKRDREDIFSSSIENYFPLISPYLDFHRNTQLEDGDDFDRKKFGNCICLSEPPELSILNIIRSLFSNMMIEKYLKIFIDELKKLNDTRIHLKLIGQPDYNSFSNIGGLVYLVMHRIPELKRLYLVHMECEKKDPDFYEYENYEDALARYLGFTNRGFLDEWVCNNTEKMGIASRGFFSGNYQCWGSDSNEFSIKLVINRLEILYNNLIKK